MRITNRYSLREPLVRAVSDERPYVPGVISVTELIKPPQMRALEIAHADEIEEDASDRIWALLGTAVHMVLEKASVDNAFQEEQLSTEINGWTVTGRPDLLEDYGDGAITLSDYKVTSVWAFLNGVKVEWEQQLNLYAWLWRLHGFVVDALEITAILRDWTKSRKAESNYPVANAMTLPVALWPQETQQEFILTRLSLHQAVIDEGMEAPECTPPERWRRPTTYAVTKHGNKRAFRVFDSLADADACRAEQGSKAHEFMIEQRLGASVRCESYCRVNHWCPQYQAARLLADDLNQETL